MERASYQSHGVERIKEGLYQAVGGTVLSVSEGTRNIVPSFLIGALVGSIEGFFLWDRTRVMRRAREFAVGGFFLGKHSVIQTWEKGIIFDERVSMKSKLLAVLGDVIVYKSKRLVKKPVTRAVLIMGTNAVTIDGIGKMFEGTQEMVFGVNK